MVVKGKLGRPRKLGVVRDEKGKSRGETEDQIKGVVLAYRAREVGTKEANNQLAGYALGRLNLNWSTREGFADPMSISQRQHDTGVRYAELLRGYAMLVGMPHAPTKSPGFDMASSGLSCSSEPEAKTIARVREQHDQCRKDLLEVGRVMEATLGRRDNRAIWQDTVAICTDQIGYGRISKEQVGNLRLGLNALARVL